MKASQKEMQRFLQLCKAIKQDCNYNKNAALHNDKFISKFKNQYIPDYLCWIFDIEKESLIFVGNTKDNSFQKELTMQGFLSKIKECYRTHFVDALIAYFTLLKKRKTVTENYLCITLPLNIPEAKNSYLYSKVSIIPNIKGSTFLGFALVVIPVNYYSSAKFYLELKLNGLVDKHLTKYIKEGIIPPILSLQKSRRKCLNLWA